MLVYTLHIFNRSGTCMYYREWSRPVPNSDLKSNNKLMFGFLFSLKQLVAKISPRKGGGFYACSTNVFKLNYFETPSGHRFILCTDLSAGDMREPLRHIYSHIFVECLVKNPLWRPNEEITNANFVQSIEKYITSL
ncbi:hypothetical protein AB1Y20_006643 [Prymnesium parvum]|uniref:Trafficking protein particle complex subunit n=1 Tax=Prymnesium parvum TaxID=97485 RepID=A0AB34J0U9_PRYPA|mmetsp:Transcript_6303/g.15908  ORF Transcript_6303/g.15908 Transcript_6303/m.15908 type:complete len:136 (+) Transcript_6303:84-491(+)